MPKTRDDDANRTPRSPPRRRGPSRGRARSQRRHRRAHRAARVPAPHRRAGEDELLADTRVRLEPCPRRAPLRVPAVAQQHVPRQRDRVRRPAGDGARRGARDHAAVDHGHDPCPRPRDHTERRDAVERRLQVQHRPAGGARTAPELSRRAALDAGRRRGDVRDLVRRHPEVRRRHDERPRRARLLHVPPDDQLDGKIRWRIRAIRADIIFASNSGTSRYNKIPAVQYGPWSPVYSSTQRGVPVDCADCGRPAEPDRTGRNRLRRLLQRRQGLPGAQAHARVPLERRPDPRRDERGAVPRVRLLRRAVPQPGLHRLGRRQPGVRAAAVRLADPSADAGRHRCRPQRVPVRRAGAARIHERLDAAVGADEPDAERGPAARHAADDGAGSPRRHAGRQRRLVRGKLVERRRRARRPARSAGRATSERRSTSGTPTGPRAATTGRSSGSLRRSPASSRRRSSARARSPAGRMCRSRRPQASRSATRSRSAAASRPRTPWSPRSDRAR